jgi:hypothetical protein
MTYRELMKYVRNSGNGNIDKSIEIKIQKASVGPTPAVGIENIVVGMDWDSGRIILIPEEPLVRQRDVDIKNG